MRFRKRLWRLLLVWVVCLTTVPMHPVQGQTQGDPEAILAAMQPEQRVGQLFLVTFNGYDLGEGKDIYNLITKYHVGGVVFLAENNNFPSEDPVELTRDMVASLQELAWQTASGKLSEEKEGQSASSPYVPLLMGVKQIGNGCPNDQILSGLTPIPSQMAIGATWDVTLAEQVGHILGSELNQIGINLYLGPNLDVLETENSEATKALGVNTYGGDPFWVGEMAKSFIKGLHIGSEDRVLVVAQNFPGSGNSDRSPDLEVATVRKSLEQLKQIELAPYFAVATPKLDDPARTDAVMVSHIRYQGFQGNIRATTRPISFDSIALQQTMTLPEFADWRESGGLIISDNLGSGGVRRFFDPNGVNFDAKQVARNAFLAGNDMLYIDDMVATGDQDGYTTLSSIIEFFVQKYKEDAAFAQRVDASVLRILTAKQGMYASFTIKDVLPDQLAGGLGDVSDKTTFTVAQNAVTLISPSLHEIDTILPSAPMRYEDLIIFTDVRTVRQCSTCPAYYSPSTNDFSDALVKLYGPQAGGQIQAYKIASYTFAQLAKTLDNEGNSSQESLLENLQTADWVIFNTVEIDPTHPETSALQRILAERPELLTGKHVIVFAMGSPLYLDATNISKVTAYYALYCKHTAFFEVASRVLMKELTPTGALPVSYNAVGYNLITMTAPDPNQVINLHLVLPEVESMPIQEDTPDVTQTPEPTPEPSFAIGDTITISTGRIHDRNQNTVPDGTIVRFNFVFSGEPGIVQQFETTTSEGIAYFAYRVDSAGELEISAISEPAIQSEVLQIDISPEGSTSITSYTPTPLASLTPTEMPSPTPTELATPAPTPTPIVEVYPSMGEWMLGVVVMGIGSGLAYLVGYYWWGTIRWGLRSGLSALIGALLAYTYLTLGTEGTKYWMGQSGTTFVIEVVVVGLLLGWLLCLIWWIRTAGRYPYRNRK